jgi:type VI secretion system protein ImpK
VSDDDPFGPSDRTIIKPSPGGRGRPAADSAATAIENRGVEAGPLLTTGANPILKAATPLLAIGGQLRRSIQYDNIDDLFRQLSQGLRNFDAELHRLGEPQEDTSIARYVLCGFLDEAILNTPWGSESNWGNRTLLAEFHNESFAGEKVFELQQRMQHDPSRYLFLLELIYVCLSLGFRGKYRLGAGGEQALEKVREDLYNIIARQRGRFERELSPAWRGAEDVRPKLTRYLPTWVFTAVAAGVMVSLFVFLLLNLESHSDPVVGQIASLGRKLEPVVERVESSAPSAQRSLVSMLTASGAMNAIESGAHDNAVVLRELFGSGSADVEASFFGVLRQIAVALDQLEGRVLVTGHSDNQPIRSLRFPSNWQLSDARAHAVGDILKVNGVAEERLTAEARADTEPVCPTCDQNTPAERARNRRVEIELQGIAGRR